MLIMDINQRLLSFTGFHNKLTRWDKQLTEQSRTLRLSETIPQRGLLFLLFRFLWHLILLAIRIQFYQEKTVFTLFQAQWWVHSQRPCECRCYIPISHTGEETCLGHSSWELILKAVGLLTAVKLISKVSIPVTRLSRTCPVPFMNLCHSTDTPHPTPHCYWMSASLIRMWAPKSWDLALSAESQAYTGRVLINVGEFVIRWLTATFEKWVIWKCVTFWL